MVVSKVNMQKFMQHIVDTNGNPTLKVAKECDLEGFFCELCMRNPSATKMVEIATMYLNKEAKANG